MENIDQERVAKGLAALRSGEYAQTKNCMRDDDGYCCLGVLNEVAFPVTEVEKWSFSHVTKEGQRRHVDDQGNTMFMGPTRTKLLGLKLRPNEAVRKEVERLIGLHAGFEVAKNFTYRDSNEPLDIVLMQMNDNSVPFSDIADVIERVVLEGEYSH